jgi:glycerol-3-phosphate dehydrogenase
MLAANERATLSPTTRVSSLVRMEDATYDVLVIGGGVTGAGTALDAAARGLSVALVEMRDWAAGTSSRSGKLIHGGLRYLEQLNFKLVHESLTERGLMLKTLCPHLTRPIQFIYPIQHRIWERPYMGMGMILYDTIGGAGAVPRHRHLTRGGIREIAPGLDETKMAGALTFYDVQMDDARHTVELVRTAAQAGADVAAAIKVVGLLKENGVVVGAKVADLQVGRVFDIRARHVINATGPWADVLQEIAGGKPSFKVTQSKGVHILVPREKIDCSISMFVRAEDSVLFVRTWGRHWLIGTTDTPWNGELDHPVATSEDIDYLLRNLNRVLRHPITVDDIDGVFAGLRPLVGGRPGATSKLSREHAIETTVPGFTTIVGGKYTTYRVMAKDVIDEAAKGLGRQIPACTTEKIPLLGARSLDARTPAIQDRAARLGLSAEDTSHLIGRYGVLTDEVLLQIENQPDLAAAIAGCTEYLRVEAVYAITHEGALHLDDVMTRRTHIAILTPDRGVSAALEVAQLIAGPLGWDDETVEREVRHYLDRVEAEVAAQRVPTDAEAIEIRNAVRDPRLAVADKLQLAEGD